MKLLKCKSCGGEVDIVGDQFLINKKIKCRDCGFSNCEEKKEPEIIVIRKRAVND